MARSTTDPRDAARRPYTVDRRAERLLADNAAAVRELIAVCAEFSERTWAAPLAAARWSPAQHVVHVTLAHVGIVADVRDGRRARLKGSRSRRAFWRLAGLSQVLWLHRLPHGADAPVEIVPPPASPPREAAMRELERRAAEFDGVLRTALSDTPAHRVQHPYFGGISLRQTLVLSAVHTRHHATILRDAARDATRRPRGAESGASR